MGSLPPKAKGIKRAKPEGHGIFYLRERQNVGSSEAKSKIRQSQSHLLHIKQKIRTETCGFFIPVPFQFKFPKSRQKASTEGI